MRSTKTNGRMMAVVGCTVVGCTLAATMLAGGCGDKPVPLTPEQKMAVQKADPQMQAVLDQLHKDGAKSFSQVTVEQARKGPSAGAAAMEVAKRKGLDVPEAVGDVKVTNFQAREGNNVSLQVYTPKGSGPFPTIVYYHGGGWVVGSVLEGNPYDGSCRALCNMANAVVVEVDYRLAPENKYPAAVNDSYDALKYVQAHPDEFKSNGKVAVLGESAGGNLAVATSLMAKDAGTALPTAVVAVYPVAGYYVQTASANEYRQAVPLDTPSLNWFYEKYLPSSAGRSARYFDILKADLHGLPPTTVITAQIDPLHDDGQRLNDALKAAGVDTRYMNYDGVTHEFFGMGGVVDKAKQAEAFAVDRLRTSWGMPAGGMSGM